MNSSAPGRTRRVVFIVIATLSTLAGLAGTLLMVAYWGFPEWQARLEPLLGNPDDSLIWQTMVGILAVNGALALLAWLFSFDPRATRRPRLGMTLVLATLGAALGTALVGPPVFLPGVAPDSAAGLAATGLVAVVLVGLWLGSEALAGAALGWLARKTDAVGQAGLALFFSRFLLLFRPGRRETLRTVALERFRRGHRDEQTRRDLEDFFENGPPDEELTESLCQLAAEERDAPHYLFLLTRLHVLRSDDTDLTEALIEENLAQGNRIEALQLIEREGVGDSISELGRYARLLVETGLVEKAVGVARRIAEKEGIPFPVSGEILGRVLEADPQCCEAMNQLGEQNLAARNLERAIRRFEASLHTRPDQPEVKRRLLELYRETHLVAQLERLLAELTGDPATATDLPLAREYAAILATLKKMEPARDYLAAMVERHPKDFHLLDLYAEVLCHFEEWKQAAEINERALEKGTPDETAKGRCRSRAARIERALLTAELYDLQQTVAAEPQNVDLALELVRRFVESGKTERAVNHADGLLDRVPEARPRIKQLVGELGHQTDGPFLLLSYLADLHLEDGEYEEAVALIEPLRSRSINPDAIETDICQRILRRKPNHLEALRRMGEISRLDKRFSEMVHYYVLYTAHGGEGAEEVNRSLFEAYENLSDYKNARPYGEKLVEAHPQDDNAPQRLARLAFAAGLLEDALHYAHLALERNPSNLESQRLVNKVDRIDRETRAKHLGDKLDRGEGTPEDCELLADLLHGLGEGDKSIALYQRAARDETRSRRARVKLALCLVEKGLHELADETLAGIQVPPDTEETPLLLDLLYRIAGYFEAERMRERAGRVYKAIFLVDAGYRDIVRKVEKFS